MSKEKKMTDNGARKKSGRFKKFVKIVVGVFAALFLIGGCRDRRGRGRGRSRALRAGNRCERWRGRTGSAHRERGECRT